MRVPKSAASDPPERKKRSGATVGVARAGEALAEAQQLRRDPVALVDHEHPGPGRRPARPRREVGQRLVGHRAPPAVGPLARCPRRVGATPTLAITTPTARNASEMSASGAPTPTRTPSAVTTRPATVARGPARRAGDEVASGAATPRGGGRRRRWRHPRGAAPCRRASGRRCPVGSRTLRRTPERLTFVADRGDGSPRNRRRGGGQYAAPHVDLVAQRVAGEVPGEVVLEQLVEVLEQRGGRRRRVR